MAHYLDRRSVLRALAVGVALPLGSAAAGTVAAASTTAWRTAGGDAGRTGQADAGPTAVTQRFTQGVTAPSEPVVVDGTVYYVREVDSLYVSTNASIEARDAVTGTKHWEVSLDEFPTASVAVAGGRVVGGSGDLVAIDADTGSVQWRAEALGAGGNTPAVVDGTVYVAAEDTDALVALDLADGTELWRQSLPARPTRSPAVADGDVVAVTADGTVRSFAASDGASRWSRTIGEDFLVRPTAVGGVVYVGEQDGSDLLALDAADGSTVWRTAVGTVASAGLASDGDSVYAVTSGGPVAVDGGSGSVEWQTDLDATFQTAPAVAGGTLYFTGSETLFVVDAADGGVLDSTAVADTGSLISGGPAVADNAVFLPDDDLYAYEPDADGVAATTNQPASVGTTTATLSGDLAALGTAGAAEVRFEFGGSFTDPVQVNSTGTVEESVSGLDEGREYEYRIVAAGDDGTTDRGDWVTFTTETSSFAVSTTSPYEEKTSAQLNGFVDALGGADSADVGFDWGEAGAGLPNAVDAGTVTGTGSFDATVDGLTQDTQYEVQARGTASDGDTAAGDVLTFTTESDSNPPAVDRLALTLDGNNAWVRVTASWRVSDQDGDLDAVDLELTDSTGTVLDSATESVSGSEGDGQTDLEAKSDDSDFAVTLVVTDAAGQTDSETQSFSK